MKILVVDDSAPIRILLTSKLKLHFPVADIVCVTNGAEGLHAVKTDEFDVIFTDIEMPDMDGPEFLKRAKLYTGAKFIAMSSLSADHINVQRIMSFGAKKFINKVDLPSVLDDKTNVFKLVNK